MKLMFVIFTVFLLAGGTSARADASNVSVDWSFVHGSTNHAVAITIKNVSREELKVRHPGLSQAIAFVVMDDRGNPLQPEGVAKVDARHKDIVLTSGGTFEYTMDQLVELADSQGLAFPFLTGTALCAYKLKEGSEYRVTVIYRPYLHREGVASVEHVVTFK
jgi:hypothetical protein